MNVHILDTPRDSGIPLIIGGRPDERGVVSSASYEARRYGIRSAMPCSQAVRLCPQVKIVPPNWPRIRDCSRQVMHVLENYGPVEQISVDEAYVDVSHELAADVDPYQFAVQVQTAVKTATRLPASVGLATNKLVAKVASDYDKPEGCTVVLPGNEAAFLADLPTRSLWGIGPRTAERLAAQGIQTCGQLAAAGLDILAPILGKQAVEVQQRACGIDARPVVVAPGPPKSISQEWTFSQDVADEGQLKAQLEKMSAGVARSLQERNLVAYTVKVKFRWDDFTTFTRQKSVTAGIDDKDAIYQLAKAIWEEHWPPGQKMRLLGVTVSNLKEVKERQLGFGF